MLKDNLPKIELPPGVYKQGTQYSVKGRWYDANLVRWVEGVLRPVGGWHRVTDTALTGKARDMICWSDNSGDRWIAVGTSSNLYASHGDGDMDDITPVGFTAGLDDATESFGYGGGNYGADKYGRPRPGGTYIPLALWSLDNWGEYLVACARQDGVLYEWQLNTASPAAAITNAPTDCVGLLVTAQRHILALGAGGNARRVEWCDKEANTVWTPAADNEAGGFELQTQSPIKGGVRCAGINLILTRTDAHVIRWIGQPFIYSPEIAGNDCGTPSSGSLISIGDKAFWMGDGCFWTYEGAAPVQIPCDVSDHVFNSLNAVQVEKVVAGHNPRFSEVWWHYPSNGSSENDRYVFYNYREKFWSIGSLSRTCWDAGNVMGFPHAMGSDNHLYRHEDEWTDNGASRYASIFAETGVMEIGMGARVAEVNQIIPDEETQGEVTVTFKTRYTPSGQEYTKGPYTVRSDGYTDARFSGRQATMKIVPTVDDTFSIGAFRLNAVPGSRR